MKIYLLRHAHKDPDGIITEEGKAAARALGKKLPRFRVVIASPSDRARQTAQLIAGREPMVDQRADFSMSTAAKSIAMNALAAQKGIPFLEAANEYNDREVLEGIATKATELSTLLEELQNQFDDTVAALVVSHDLSISPAMAQRSILLQSIDFLNGYIIKSDGTVTVFAPDASE